MTGGCRRYISREAVLLALLGLTILTACRIPVQYRDEVKRSTALDLRAAVTELFESYEIEHSNGFIGMLDDDFRSNDWSGHAYARPFMANAIHDDMRNLQNVTFEVFVESAVPYERGSKMRLELIWFRRAFVPFSGEEWIVRGARSAIVMQRSQKGWKLWATEGAPLFGISNPMGTIRVAEGTINGRSPGAGARIENGRYIP